MMVAIPSSSSTTNNVQIYIFWWDVFFNNIINITFTCCINCFFIWATLIFFLWVLNLLSPSILLPSCLLIVLFWMLGILFTVNNGISWSTGITHNNYCHIIYGFFFSASNEKSLVLVRSVFSNDLEELR